jgi:hypothetical protein
MTKLAMRKAVMPQTFVAFNTFNRVTLRSPSCEAHTFHNVGFRVGFEVLNSSIFWDITPCILLKANQSSRASNPVSRWFLARVILRPLRWRHVPSERRLTFNGLHAVISQKVEIFCFQGLILGPRATTLVYISALLSSSRHIQLSYFELYHDCFLIYFFQYIIHSSPTYEIR